METMNRLAGVILIIAVIVALLSPFIANFCTDYLPKKGGSREDVRMFKCASPPSPSFVECITLHGDKKNPRKNFNSASCTKLDFYGIQRCCPEILDLYFNKKVCADAAKALGVTNLYLQHPEFDTSCVFLKNYVGGDHLWFHYDNNFCVGTRYTAVIPIQVSPGNTSEFMMIDKDYRVHIVRVPRGHGVVYDGWQIRHAISAQAPGESRTVVVIQLYDDPRVNAWGRVRKAARDLTYRVLTL